VRLSCHTERAFRSALVLYGQVICSYASIALCVDNTGIDLKIRVREVMSHAPHGHSVILNGLSFGVHRRVFCRVGGNNSGSAGRWMINVSFLVCSGSFRSDVFALHFLVGNN